MEHERIEQLAQLLDGELAQDEVGAQLRSLAQLAASVREEIALERPDPAFKAALRAQLIEATAAAQLPLLDRVRDAVRERTARVRHSAKVATATATASMMLGTAGVAAAAQSALPGDALYGVKSATESLRFAFASGSEEIGRLHLAMAAERLDEVAGGVDRLSPDQVIATLERMDASSRIGAEEMLRAFQADPSPRILEELHAFSARQRAILTEVVDRLPLEAKPFAEESLELLRRIDIALESSAADCACGLEGLGAATIAGRSGITGVGDGSASSATCDCAGTEVPLSTAREPRPGTPGSSTGAVGSVGSTLGGNLPGSSTGGGTTGGSGGTTGSGGRTLGLPTELDTSTVGGGTTGSLTEPVTGAGSDPVETATDTVGDTVTDPVDEVTDTASEVVEEATETVTDTASEIGGTIGSPLP